MRNNKNILILTSGSVLKLESFKSVRNQVLSIKLASFNDINFSSRSKKVFLKNKDLAEFDVIYFRLIGKSLEIASLVADYAKNNNIKLVDKVYTNSTVFPVTQSKAMEMKALSDHKVTIPKTYFGSLENISKNYNKMFKFPFVVKATSGSHGREVYSPQNMEELEKLVKDLKLQEKQGKKFFAQEFIPCTKRIRALVVGGKVLGAISQLTKWRKRIGGYSPEENEIKIEKYELDDNLEKLALDATNATNLDICGVDILISDVTGKAYVIEANAAPGWKLINKYCGVLVEDEIIKYLQKQI